jgi:hypothetical protein
MSRLCEEILLTVRFHVWSLPMIAGGARSAKTDRSNPPFFVMLMEISIQIRNAACPAATLRIDLRRGASGC